MFNWLFKKKEEEHTEVFAPEYYTDNQILTMIKESGCDYTVHSFDKNDEYICNLVFTGKCDKFEIDYRYGSNPPYLGFTKITFNNGCYRELYFNSTNGNLVSEFNNWFFEVNKQKCLDSQKTIYQQKYDRLISSMKNPDINDRYLMQDSKELFAWAFRKLVKNDFWNRTEEVLEILKENYILCSDNAYYNPDAVTEIKCAINGGYIVSFKDVDVYAKHIPERMLKKLLALRSTNGNVKQLQAKVELLEEELKTVREKFCQCMAKYSV